MILLLKDSPIDILFIFLFVCFVDSMRDPQIPMHLSHQIF